jgi:hypothetical protein
MRYVSLLLMVVFFLLLAMTSEACWRPMIRDFDGDPDEFQAANVHSETGSAKVSPWQARIETATDREQSEPEAFPEVRRRRRFSMSLPGRQFFLEK